MAKELSRYLALDQEWIYKPADVLNIFQKYFESGVLDFELPRKYPITRCRDIINRWRDEDESLMAFNMLTISYMCANNILPIILFLYQQGDINQMQYLIRLFIIDIFNSLINYDQKPNKFIHKLNLVKNRINKDFYWNEDLIYLKNQILIVIKKYQQTLKQNIIRKHFVY